MPRTGARARAGAATVHRAWTPISHRQTLWTAATCSHPDLSTALSRCFPAASPSSSPSSTSSSSSTTKTSSSSSSSNKNSVTIILASRSFPGSDLLSLPSKLPSHISSSSSHFILGAVVDRVPTPTGHGVSTLTLTPDQDEQQSLASTSRLLSVQPFYLSGAESRRKRLKEKSVGKWARSQDIEERSLDTADAWAAFKSISIGRNQVQVPQAVLPPPSSFTTTTTATTTTSSSSSPSSSSQEILMMSDMEVHQFLEALDHTTPAAHKFGILASSTPFITGRPVTMFYDGKVVQDGVLGVSIVRSSADRHEGETKTTVDYPSMAPLGPAMQITRCRGNIILELDESNATRLLLDRLSATTLTKDKEYFLATGEPTRVDIHSSQDQIVNIDMKQATVYKITGGDPSKGNMAVDTVHDLNVGQWVQFMHHDRGLDHGHYDPSLSSNNNNNNNNNTQGMVRFTTTDPNNTIEEQSDLKGRTEADADAVQALFGGSSENGFMVGQPHGQTWVCTVTDSVLTRTE
ncbi:hypothetical protein EDD11_000194 [Mortierella claussenii]|nr:hypothetical protein EDD11_000194 [Mortierella claussenii]